MDEVFGVGEGVVESGDGRPLDVNVDGQALVAEGSGILRSAGSDDQTTGSKTPTISWPVEVSTRKS